MVQVELSLELKQTSVVVVPQCERGTRARRRDLKLIDDLFPKLERAHTLVAPSDDHRLKELTKVEFPAADRGHLEVVVAHELLLERDHPVTELDAFLLLVLWVEEFEVAR